MRPPNPTRRPSHPNSPVQPGGSRAGWIIAAAFIAAGVGWTLANRTTEPAETAPASPEKTRPELERVIIEQRPENFQPPQPIADGERLDRSIRPLLRAFSSDDYPKEAMLWGQEGSVGYRLDIDAAGTPTCSIAKSSGVPSLDAVTCRKLGALRFKPSAGGPTVLNGNVRWVLPR